VRRAMGETRELSRQLDLVGSVADTAESLASQSEVLALNASVEAARSGANGGGFTAVAEETRRLTESSRVAALRVTEVVHGIRGRVDEVLAALQTAAVRVAETDATAQRSALALEEIGRLVDAMREIASRVARSAEESRRVGSRFGELRSHLERIAQENVVAGEAVTAAAAQQSGATDDIATSAAELLEASERLSALVAGFRV
jgi:methyl-accepting chemotaxis protein